MSAPRRFRLGHSHAVGAVDDLALQIGHIHDVEVDDADGAHAGRRKVEHGRRSQPAGADEERARGEQPGLARRSDLRDEQVARVALLLFAAQDDGLREGSTLRLPGLETAAHGGHILVAHALQHLRREQGSDATRAVEDEGHGAVGRQGLDLLLDVRARDVPRTIDVTLLPLAGLADIHEQRARGERQGGLAGAHLRHTGARLAQEIPVGGGGHPTGPSVWSPRWLSARA